MLHRIEVEHALSLANATQEQINETLVENFASQVSVLENLSDAVTGIEATLSSGFTDLANSINSALNHGFADLALGVAQVNANLATIEDGVSAVRQSVYQLHLDTLGTHDRLDDILACLVDKDSFQRTLAVRQQRSNDDAALYRAKGEYSDSLRLIQRALNEADRQKADAMLDEAIVLMERASTNSGLYCHANFQLGWLHQFHRRSLQAAHTYYKSALGPSYSPHFVRTSRHLAHVSYLLGQTTEAFSTMQSLVNHDEALIKFRQQLMCAKNADWPECMNILERTLFENASLLNECTRLKDVVAQFNERRRFTATENFMVNADVILGEIPLLRPDSQIYYEGARFAAKEGMNQLSATWLKQLYQRQKSLKARRTFLLTAMSEPDFNNA